MFFATVLTQLVLKHVKDIRHRYVIALAAAVFATVSGGFAWFPFSLQSAIFAVPFIMLGYDAKQYGIFEKIRLRHALISLCVFAVGFYMSLTQISFVTASMNDILFTPIFAISASVVIVYVSQKLEFMRPLAFVGKYSMYYLCIHLFEMETTGYWFIELLKLLNIPVCPLSMFIVRVIYGTLMTFAVIGITRLFTYLKKQPKPSGNRDSSLDVEKGILIILMIIGHFSMYRGLRNIIYSFHMPAFILLSGYMFKSKACDTLLRSVLRLVKSFLLPYAVFAVGHVILAPGLVQNKLLSVLFGISFKKVLFQDIAGIGAMWFVLLLFVIRVVYLIMCRLIKNEYALHGAVLLVTFIGYFISKQGWWLPWSVDVALFSIIFYHIGRMLKQYNVLEYIASRPYFYFLLTPIWAYVVFACPIELATRAYGVAGFSILGGIMGTLVVYMLSRYVLNSCGRIIGRIMCAIGRNTLYILILYSLFSTMVKHGLTDIFGLTDGYIYHMIATVAVIVIAGTAVGLVKESISKLFSKSS